MSASHDDKQVRSKSAENQSGSAAEQVMQLAHRWAQATYLKALGRPFEDFDVIQRQMRQLLSAMQSPQENAPVPPATPNDTEPLPKATAAREFGARVFKQVEPGIEVGYDLFGGVDIRLGGDFVYVHIAYDHRYTDNYSRSKLADKVVGFLTGSESNSPELEGIGNAPSVRDASQPLSSETVRLAKVALHEMPHASTDLHEAAKRVCLAVVAAQKGKP